MWDPNDGMSPMNPFSAPNVLAGTEKILADQRAAAARKDAAFIEQMNKKNARGSNSGYGQKAVRLAGSHEQSAPGRGKLMEFWTPSTVFAAGMLVVIFLIVVFS